MHKLTNAIMAVLFGSASFAGIAYTQALHPSNAHTGIFAFTAAVARADEGENEQGDQGGDEHHGGQGCVNPAGHERGWCKHGDRNSNDRGGNYSTISGTVIASNGDLVQFREDNGATITLNQRNLLANGYGLNVGSHYTLRGYWNNNMFLAQATGGGYYGNNNNGYPYGGSTSIQGVVTSVHGNRVTLLQGLFQTITVDDQQALNNGSAQNLYVGRNITAYGFWSGSTFYATSIG